jgi:hypothetical protein
VPEWSHTKTGSIHPHHLGDVGGWENGNVEAKRPHTKTGSIDPHHLGDLGQWENGNVKETRKV